MSPGTGPPGSLSFTATTALPGCGRRGALLARVPVARPLPDAALPDAGRAGGGGPSVSGVAAARRAVGLERASREGGAVSLG